MHLQFKGSFKTRGRQFEKLWDKNWLIGHVFIQFGGAIPIDEILSEMKAEYERQGKTMPTSVEDKLKRQIDKDSNGQLDYEEFGQLVSTSYFITLS